jgi:hypothetical protein
MPATPEVNNVSGHAEKNQHKRLRRNAIAERAILMMQNDRTDETNLRLLCCSISLKIFFNSSRLS